MTIHRRNFLKTCVTGLPLSGMGKPTVKTQTKQQHDNPAHLLEHLRLDAFNVFDRIWLSPGCAPEFPMDIVAPGTPENELPRAVFMDRGHHFKKLVRHIMDVPYLYVPCHEYASSDISQWETIKQLGDKIEMDCREVLISAGMWNHIWEGSRSYVQDKICETLGTDAKLFYEWVGPAPAFYKYAVGIKYQTEKFIIIVREEPTVYQEPKELGSGFYAWTDMGIALLDHRLVSIGKING